MSKIENNTPLNFASSVKLAGDRLTVMKSSKSFTIRAPKSLLKDLFETVDGKRDFKTIVDGLSKSFDRETIVSFLNDLVSRGILVPTKYWISHQWSWVHNPQPYPSDVPPELPFELAKAASDRVQKLDPKAKTFRPPKTKFIESLQNRGTDREFDRTAMSMDQITALLYAGYGVLDATKKLGKYDQRAGRTVPSGGGVYPLEFTWIQWRKTNKLDAGVYHVSFGKSRKIGFKKLSSPPDKLFRALLDPTGVASGHGAIVISGNFAHSGAKYGNRSVSYCLIETGHAAQNIQLCALEMGVGVYLLGGYMDERIKPITELPNHDPYLVMVVGNQLSPKEKSKINKDYDLSFSWVDFDSNSYQPPFYFARTNLFLDKLSSGWCWGRDADPLLAYDKAIAESVERLSCQMPRDIKKATAGELDRFVDPEKFVQYSKEQYERPEFPLSPFSKRRKYEWVRVKHLVTDEPHWVLADQVYFSSKPKSYYMEKRRKKSELPYTFTSTSGVAAYPTFEGALDRAIVELIERDQFMRTWLGKISLPKVILSSIPSELQNRIRGLNKIGWEAQVLVMSQEPITSFLLFSQNTPKKMTRVTAAAGYDPFSALEHGISELESMVTLTDQIGNPIPISPENASTPEDHVNLYSQRRYYKRADHLLRGSDVIDFSGVKSHCEKLNSLKNWLTERARNSYYLDITPAICLTLSGGSTIKVVRALIEGMVPISFGYGLEPILPEVKNRGTKPRKGILFPHPFP